MKLSFFGRMALALLATVALGLGMTACGGGTIGYLWVVGSQYNQIAGFKVDDFTGNLTQVPRSPFSTNGVNPVSILVRPGGRYVYVINQGSGGGPQLDKTGTAVFSKGTSSNISVFSVGGDGTLTFEVSYQSQGYVPVWAQFDGTGGFLYVLDKYSPGASPSACLANPTSTACFGSITAFSIDGSTGRLTLVGNSQSQAGGVNTYFFNVGVNPFMMKTSGGCLYTVNSGDQSISPYGINTSNGQLTLTTTQNFPTGVGNISSINGNGSYVFLTDSANNRIFPFTNGSNCALTILTGGSVANITGTSNPTYSFIDNSGKYLYVLNQSTTSTGTTTTPFSSISAFTLTPSTGQPVPIQGAPYSVGSGPVCMVEDTTNQYVYISNHNDGTVTGKVIDTRQGPLSNLSRGATFQATGQAGCLALSGNVS